MDVPLNAEEGQGWQGHKGAVMGPLGQEWVGGVPVVVPNTVGIVSAAGASWGWTEGSQWWAGSGSEGANTMPHSQHHQAKYCKVIRAAKTQMPVSIIFY